MSMDRRIAVLLPLLLLPLGCSLCATPLRLFQTTALAGDADGLRKFAGRWFDEEGKLIAVVSSPPGPRLSIQTPYDLDPKDARLQNGEIVFRLGSRDQVSLRLTGADELLVSVAEGTPDPFSASSCSCTDSSPVLVLVRDPSPAWHMERSMRKAAQASAQLARKAYEGMFDRLARVL